MPYKEGELKSKLRTIRSTIELELDVKSPTLIQDEKNIILGKRQFGISGQDQ